MLHENLDQILIVLKLRDRNQPLAWEAWCLVLFSLSVSFCLFHRLKLKRNGVHCVFDNSKRDLKWFMFVWTAVDRGSVYSAHTDPSQSSAQVIEKRTVALEKSATVNLLVAISGFRPDSGPESLIRSTTQVCNQNQTCPSKQNHQQIR